MATIQGGEVLTLSPQLLQILDEMHPHQPPTGGVGRSAAVGELSRLFTKGREALGTDYLKDPALAAAYLSYFFPVNLSKIQALLDELPGDWHALSNDRPLRVLDLGSGPGTGAVAVLDWLNRHNPDRIKNLAVVAVDASADALRGAQRLWTAYARHTPVGTASLTVHEGDLTRRKSGWQDEVERRGPYDLIIIANCLNEIFGRSQDAITERSVLIAGLLTQLAPHGTLMLVEPALRETSRALHELRDHLLADSLCTVYSPCLHDRNCPALLDPYDWCHEERPWRPPHIIQEIDRQVGFIKDALKFSYLLLRTDGQTIVDRSTHTFRMVSELRRMKGDTRAWLCNELGRREVGRLDRASSVTNSEWDHCQRGTIVRIEGMKRKDEATLTRIPADATVGVVRPI